MDEEAERKAFHDRLRAFNDERGYTSNPSPTISKQSLDLFLLYNTIKSRGGFVSVSKARQWKDCAQYCNLTLNSSAAYTLKKQYIKHLLPFECHYDRGGVDPQELIVATEPGSKKKHAKASGGPSSPGPADSNSQGSLSSNSTTCSSSYPTSGTPNASNNTSSFSEHNSNNQQQPNQGNQSQSTPTGGPNNIGQQQQFPPNPSSLPPGSIPAGYNMPPGMTAPSNPSLQGNQQQPPGGYPVNHAPPVGSIPGGYSMLPGQGGHHVMPPHAGYPPHSAYNGQSYPPHHHLPGPYGPHPPLPPTGHPGQHPQQQHPPQGWQANPQQQPPPHSVQQQHPPQMYGQHLPTTGPLPASHPTPSLGIPSSSGMTTPSSSQSTTSSLASTMNQQQGQHPQQHPPHHGWQSHPNQGPPPSVQQQPQHPPGHHQWPQQQQPQGHHGIPPPSQQPQQSQQATPTSQGGQSISAQDPFSDEMQSSASYGQQNRSQGVIAPRATPPSSQSQQPIPSSGAVGPTSTAAGMPPHSSYNGQSYGQPAPPAGYPVGQQGPPRHPPPRSTPPTTPQPPPTSMPQSSHPAPPSGYPGQYGYSSTPQYQMPNERFPRPTEVDYNRMQPPGQHPHPGMTAGPEQGYRQQQPQSYYGQQPPPQHPGQQPTASTQGVQQRPQYGDYRAYPTMNRPDMTPYGGQHQPQQPGVQPPQQQSYYGQQPTPPGGQHPLPPHQQQSPQSQSSGPPSGVHPNQQQPPRPGYGDYRDNRAYPPMNRPDIPPYGQHGPPAGHSMPPHSGGPQPGSHSVPVSQGPPRPSGPPPPLSQGSPGGPTAGPMNQSMPPSLYGPNRESGPPTRYPMGPPSVPPQQQGMPGHQGHPHMIPPHPQHHQMSGQQHPHGHPGHRPMGPPSTMPMPPQQPFPPSGGGPGMMMMPHQMIMRKEITFPPGSVEATQPILVKRRKITARDISQIEAWRILMSLKSGLLAESTWALDVLTVLAYDDSTFGCFVLSGMPGLLDTLLEHYRKCLSQLFHGLLSDRKDSHPKKIHDKSLEEEGEEFVQEGERSLSGNLCRFRIRKSTSSKNKKWYEIDDDIKENSESVALLEVESVNPCDHYSSSLSINSLSNHSRNSSSSLQSPSSLSSPVKQESNRTSNDLGAKHKLTNNNQSHIPLTKAFPLQETQIDEREQELQVLLNGPFNFTNRSRDGKPVKIIESKDDLSICDLEKKWSRLRNPLLFDEDSLTNDSGIDQDWDESQHILTQFAPKHKTVRFVRVMKSSNEDIPVQENKSEEKCLIHQEEDKSLQKVIKNHVIQSESKKQEENEGSEVTVDSNEKYPRFREPRKRKHDLFDDFEEEEAYQKDHPSLYPVEEYAEGLSRRCLVLSTLIRNLSFVSGNENELARHEGVMRVLSRLLLLNHEHPAKSKTCMKQPPVIDETTDESLFNEEVTKEEEKLEEDDNEELDLGSDEWYWDAINTLLENTLVTLANVSGQIDLSPFPEDVSLPLLDGLLHWAVCPSSFAQDHLPMTSITNLSPQRLALETLVKLSIREGNVDLMLATPPWERLDRLFKTLSKKLARNEDQTLREFALVMLVNMSTADTSIARAVALTGNAIPQLISFVEQSEQSAMSVAQSHGVNALRENPEMMGTTLDMVRRAALCLRALSRIPDNRPLFSIYQQRLLNLVMSQILDQGVAAIMADVMYECSLSDPILHTSRETFLTYITPIVGESHVVTSRPLTPPAPASSAASMVSGDHHHHNMINSKDSSGNHEVRSHAALVNSNHSNGSLSASQLITNGPVGSPLLNNTSKSVLPELLKREITSSPVPLKAVSPVIMNGCMDSPTSNHLDSLHNHDRNKIELSKVPPPVKMDNSLKAIETTPVVAVNNHDNSVKNNGTNTDKGCPRLKELLLSYQMSPKFDGHDSPTQPPQEQITS